MAETIIAQILQRGDTEANLILSNVLLLKNELCFSTDTIPVKMKLGDGVNRWKDIPYFAGVNGVGVQSAAINSSGHLILTMTNGSTIDAGNTVGATGVAGKDGTNGTGLAVDWVTSTAYILNQLIVHDNILYRCTMSHTSDASFDVTKFTALGGGGSTIPSDWGSITESAVTTIDWGSIT